MEEKLSAEKLSELTRAVLESPFGKKYNLWTLKYLVKDCSEEEQEDYEGYEEEEEEDSQLPDAVLFEDACDAVYQCANADSTQKLTPEVARLAEYVLPLGEFYGNSNAVNDLGAWYYDGRLGQDFAKAKYYYKLAEKMGNGYSAENLGYIYYYGRCGEVDYEKAFRQFSKGAVTFNRAISFYKLGDMYKNGYYVEKDPTAAFRCFENARKLIDNGEHANRYDNCAADIYFRLGEASLKGIGTRVDVAKAMEYLQTAERAFYVRLANGEYMLKKVLRRTLELEEEARKILVSRIPDFEWAAQNTGNRTM